MEEFGTLLPFFEPFGPLSRILYTSGTQKKHLELPKWNYKSKNPLHFRKWLCLPAQAWLAYPRSFTPSASRLQSESPPASPMQNIKGHIRADRGWWIYSKRHELEPTAEAHLKLAIRYENIDLLVLKRVFLALPAEAVEHYVLSAPTSILTRRAWYLYELLTGRTLDLPDAPNVTSVDLLDTDKYCTTSGGTLSRRHKVRDNLLGSARFCPIIRKTEVLKDYVDSDLCQSARSIIGRISKTVVARAASFMLLADSQASFQIEGEQQKRR